MVPKRCRVVQNWGSAKTNAPSSFIDFGWPLGPPLPPSRRLSGLGAPPLQSPGAVPQGRHKCHLDAPPSCQMGPKASKTCWESDWTRILLHNALCVLFCNACAHKLKNKNEFINSLFFNFDALARLKYEFLGWNRFVHQKQISGDRCAYRSSSWALRRTFGFTQVSRQQM